MNVLICLPVLSPHLDQLPPFADLVAAKHLGQTNRNKTINSNSNYASDRRPITNTNRHTDSNSNIKNNGNIILK